MSLRLFLFAGLLLVLATLGLTAWAWTRIPDTALIATHWDVQGHVNGHMHKFPGLLIGPGVMVFIMSLFWVITLVEPRRNNLAQSRMLMGVGLLGGMAIGAIAQFMVVTTALGHQWPPVNFTLPAVAVLMILIGNFLGKTRSNFFVGVRTPWTLESDYSWEKTHRWAGRMFMLSGLATLVALALGGTLTGGTVLGVTITATALISVVLSYVFWRQDPERHAHDSVPE